MADDPERERLAAAERLVNAVGAPPLLPPSPDDDEGEPIFRPLTGFDLETLAKYTANAPSLYADKCAECTTGLSCEDAGRCLFEG